jgi:hypothetical protein
MFTVMSVSSSANSTESSFACSSRVGQPCGFYSWSTSSSASAADDVGVLFEIDRRQRERLYISLKLIFKKPVASKSVSVSKMH